MTMTETKVSSTVLHHLSAERCATSPYQQRLKVGYFYGDSCKVARPSADHKNLEEYHRCTLGSSSPVSTHCAPSACQALMMRQPRL